MNDKKGLLVLFAAVLLHMELLTGVMAQEPAELRIQQETAAQWTQEGIVSESKISLKKKSGFEEAIAGIGGTVLVIVLVVFGYISETNKDGYERDERDPLGIFKDIFTNAESGRNIERRYGCYQPPEKVNLSRLYVKDPDFSSEKFTLLSKDAFISLIGALRAQEPEKIRFTASYKMYQDVEKTIQASQSSNVKKVWDQITVRSNVITDYEEKENAEYLTVALEAYMEYYAEDISTGQLEAGQKGIRSYSFALEFVRGAGLGPADHAQTAYCPNCGAPVDLEMQKECGYCHSIIKAAGSKKWLLNQCGGL